mmetsp:Transcript_545/g.1540  ORF Transcript_545/g.1540 Transcript_545/m.1540 type:complete len:293 (+) Transcript_545:703-1581(+)
MCAWVPMELVGVGWVMVSFCLLSKPKVCAARSEKFSADTDLLSRAARWRSLASLTALCASGWSLPTTMPSMERKKNVSVSLSITGVGAASSSSVSGYQSSPARPASSSRRAAPAADHAACGSPDPERLPWPGRFSEKDPSPSRMLPDTISDDSCMEVVRPPDFCRSPDMLIAWDAVPSLWRVGPPAPPLTRDRGVTSRPPSKTRSSGCAGSGCRRRGPPGSAREMWLRFVALERFVVRDRLTDEAKLWSTRRDRDAIEDAVLASRTLDMAPGGGRGGPGSGRAGGVSSRGCW